MGWVRVAVLMTMLGANAAHSTTEPARIREATLATMHAFVAMNLEEFMASMAADITGFEMDLEGAPVRLGSRDEVAQWAREVFGGLQAMGATMKLEIHSAECHADSRLAYCTVDFDLLAQMADGSVSPQPSRNTIVLREEEDGWKWVHWHSSAS